MRVVNRIGAAEGVVDVMQKLLALICLMFLLTTSSFGLDARLTTYAEMEIRLERALAAMALESHAVEQFTIGQSVQGRELWAVRFKPNELDEVKKSNVVRLVLIGLQHGNEHAGKEALLDLIEQYADGSRSLDARIDLHIIPMANPDGNDTDKRRNANDFDLNRDHIILSQPETQLLHRYIHRVQPHYVIDCHEFNRTTRDYTEQGWEEWPLIMLGAVNSPLLPAGLYHDAVALIDDITPTLHQKQINFSRYIIGDAPGTPNGELRYSTMDCDDARNGLSMHGCMGFIIESGVKRSHDDPQADLPERVEAYLELFAAFMQSPKFFELAPRISHHHAEPVPATIPTNFFWAEHFDEAGEQVTPTLPVLVKSDDAAKRTVVQQAAPNFKAQRVVKRRVPTPAGYVIVNDSPIASSSSSTSSALYTTFASLLQRHHLPYQTFNGDHQAKLQPIQLVNIEDGYDTVYHRYSGRQITEPLPVKTMVLPVNALVVDFEKLSPMDVRRAIAVLEPQLMFGLYQWPNYQELITQDAAGKSILPVYRLMDPK